MNIHWGTGLAIGFALFALGILALVAISMNQTIDLVRDDYYQEELRHQKQIERAQRSIALSERPVITSTAIQISIRFPKFFAQNTISGTLSFYRPSDRSSDFGLPIAVDTANTQHVKTDSLAKGLWRLKVFWTSAQVEYFHEEVIIIQ